MTVPSELAARAAAATFFVIMLAWACVTDLRTRKIRNTNVLGLAVGGLLYSAAVRGGWPGASFALGGMLLGFAVWVLFHVLGMLGAGDVKFFAAAGAWLGPAATIDASLAAAAFGGLFAVIWMVREYGWSLATMRLAHGVRQPRTFAGSAASLRSTTRRLPYGVPMAIGIGAAACARHLFW